MIEILDLEGVKMNEMAMKIAGKVKQRRLERNLTQAGLASRADIPLPTYRLFERTGKISLQNLLKLAFALNCLDDFNALFQQRQWQSLDEMLENKNMKRKRGTRK